MTENHNNSNSSNNTRSHHKITIKEEIDEGVVEAIVEIVVVVDEEMETTTTTTRIMVVEMETEMVLLKRNVEDVIEEEIATKVEVMEEEAITMVEIPSKIIMEAVVVEIINRRMAKHLEKVQEVETGAVRVRNRTLITI